MKKILVLLLIFLLPFVSITAAGADETGQEDDVIELTATLLPTYELGVTQQLDNPDNVVTPYISEKFGLKITEVLKVPPDMIYPQAIAMWKAAGMAPDIMQCGAEDFGAMVQSGVFAPLDDYLADMPNYANFLPEKYWSRETGDDGKVYAFYNLPGNAWPKPEPPSNDVVSDGINTRALWVREDILKAIGYTFNPIMDLKKATADVGIRPTYEQLEISPAIETPEDFMALLRKIRDADLKAMDGSDVIPFSMVWWETWHVGVMFDWGYWRINRDGEVDGYLGLPGTREYMEWLWVAYREGLIDPDYLVHKSVQLQEKVATGKIAAGEYVPDALGTFKQLEENIPGAVRHFIPFPKESPDYGFYDPYNPHPYHRTLLNKDLSDEAMTRIAKFVDWTYTDEGASVLAWGPESAGLYTETAEGRRFVDKAVEEAVMSGAVDGEGVYKWGLFDSVIGMASDPLTNALGPTNLHSSVFNAYNETSNYMRLASSVVASNPKFLGVSTQLQVANSDQSEVVQAVADWYWGIFSQTYLPQVLKAETKAEFNEKYDQMVDAFMRETNYKEAKANMEVYFEKFPPMFD
jgi:ABC-type glycerol-3-phosphate transport system substrate-binding protein